MKQLIAGGEFQFGFWGTVVKGCGATMSLNGWIRRLLRYAISPERAKSNSTG
jgi:hypothetical protein